MCISAERVRNRFKLATALPPPPSINLYFCYHLVRDAITETYVKFGAIKKKGKDYLKDSRLKG